jgi:hypothetical protein
MKAESDQPKVDSKEIEKLENDIVKDVMIPCAYVLNSEQRTAKIARCYRKKKRRRWIERKNKERNLEPNLLYDKQNYQGL